MPWDLSSGSIRRRRLILRWPWKLQQLGFIIPHIGLIVLLVGCFLSRHYGMEATLSVFEGESSDLAYKGSEQHVELDGQQQFHLKVISADGREKPGELIVVPFTSGPFNWEDYHNGTLASLPGRWCTTIKACFMTATAFAWRSSTI